MIIANSIKGKYYVDMVTLGDKRFFDIMKLVCGRSLRIMRYNELEQAINDLDLILRGKGLNRW